MLGSMRKDHLIEALWSSQKMKKIENLKTNREGDFAGHRPINVILIHMHQHLR